MPMAWASVAAAPPKSLTPEQRMQELREFYDSQPLCAIVQETLGLRAIPGTTGGNAGLIEHAVVIGIDTEAWTRNTNEMTEIGLAVYERKEMMEVQREKNLWEIENGWFVDGHDHLGPFGEQLLMKMRFYHLRIVENAHLKTNAKWMKGAEGNRFGHSRFVTFAEARDILDSLFDQPIVSDDPKLQGCKKPIILVGHAISHDRLNCKNHGLDYDWFKHGTIVREVDTQPLAKATGTWFDFAAPNNEVGLAKLTKTLGFLHEDPHTACNDAARTVISAIQMVLPRESRESLETDMQTVARYIEQRSKQVAGPSWGSALYCTRCGGRDHENKDEGNRCAERVYCRACAQHDWFDDKENSDDSFGSVGEVKETEEYWETHIEECCLHIAEYNAWVRRCNDATRKRKPLPPGPPECSHPGSNTILTSTWSYTPSHPSATAQSSGGGGRRVRRHVGSQKSELLGKNWRRGDDGHFNW
ncbi:hypothetical protein LEMA_P112670.1 [Plenodomus lingam JN3]|uniref:Gfd2/YDR514C-like C-terminal domain-containing protein n=1 Tax=Leptosphaeria maculans (strain JN3 / isolate v23.1.3 / race Av1-4-5-6-7-8) TaxID=985895 RepID=E4ZYA3_LEPMJ|nr:hypothetical protein LEMA_P112670.1 [Plenodomus lingam JN3]CBX96348.1 hypothetical protein LEMA_P112670.1 [Plenodomus lingam JN3]